MIQEELWVEKRPFNIWMEGYSATGEHAGAHYVGRVSATSFQEACNTYYLGDALYDSERRTYWGCRLFSNEDDARRGFG